MRSVDSGQLVEPIVESKYGEVAFGCYAACKWNKLPTEVKSDPSANDEGFSGILKSISLYGLSVILEWYFICLCIYFKCR